VRNCEENSGQDAGAIPAALGAPDHGSHRTQPSQVKHKFNASTFSRFVSRNRLKPISFEFSDSTPFEHHELMAQRQDFEGEIVPASEERKRICQNDPESC
jgi:hypothetical protein